MCTVQVKTIHIQYWKKLLLAVTGMMMAGSAVKSKSFITVLSDYF